MLQDRPELFMKDNTVRPNFFEERKYLFFPKSEVVFESSPNILAGETWNPCFGEWLWLGTAGWTWVYSTGKFLSILILGVDRSLQEGDSITFISTLHGG